MKHGQKFNDITAKFQKARVDTSDTATFVVAVSAVPNVTVEPRRLLRLTFCLPGDGLRRPLGRRCGDRARGDRRAGEGRPREVLRTNTCQKCSDSLLPSSRV